MGGFQLAVSTDESMCESKANTKATAIYIYALHCICALQRHSWVLPNLATFTQYCLCFAV